MDSSVLTRDRPAHVHTVDSADEASGNDSLVLVIARVLYGGILALMALDNLGSLDQRIDYARSKGAPVPRISVPFISGALFSGSLGVVFWRRPTIAAGAVATFFVAVTPQMHDFWALDDEDQRQQQRRHFLKNTALLGGALAFMRLGAATE